MECDSVLFSPCQSRPPTRRPPVHFLPPASHKLSLQRATRSRERPASDVFLFSTPLYTAGACLMKPEMRLTSLWPIVAASLTSDFDWSFLHRISSPRSLRMLAADGRPRIEAASSMLTRDIRFSDTSLRLECYEHLLCPLGCATAVCFRLLCINILW